jgi:hypothetical protein
MLELEAGSARERWRRARTFDELCRLAAEFIEGRLDFFPGWGAATLDPESDGIAAHLARFQRAGFLTVASQPGRSHAAGDGGGACLQRAFVCGFADGRAARALSRARVDANLSIRMFRRGDASLERVPVTLVGGTPRVLAGYPAFEEELVCFEDHVSRDALQALASSTYVSAIDLAWGRDDVLWPFLEGALGAA